MKRLDRIVHWAGVALSSVIAGVLAGFFVYGPLQWGLALSLLVLVAATSVWGVLWLYTEKLASQKKPNDAQRDPRPLRLGLRTIPLVGLVGMFGFALLQLYNMGQFAPLRADKLHNFDRLTRAMAVAYPYFDEKGIDWPATVARYRPQVEAATDEADYRAVLAEMAASLEDTHTTLYPLPRMVQFGIVADVAGQPLIVSLGEAAQAAGLAVGDIVLAVDDTPLEEYLDTLPPQWRNGSTPWNRLDGALRYVLTLQEGAEQIGVTVRKADGATQMVTLTMAAAEAYAPTSPAEMPPLVWGERRPSGLGYIHLGRSFNHRNGRNMTEEFDAALAPLMDTPGLILDLRDNSGGNSVIAGEIAGRFLAQPFAYGREHYEVRLPTRVWWKWADRRTVPRGERYTGPVVILTDATTVSSAEEFVISLVDAGRAVTVGRNTAGATGNPLSFQLGQGTVLRFSSGDLRRVDGTPIEGIGIAPDLPVTWTVADVRERNDPDIVAAEGFLTSKE